LHLLWTRGRATPHSVPADGPEISLAPLAGAAAVVACGCAAIAVGLAQSQPYVQLVAVSALAFAVVALSVRDRRLLLLVALVLASQRLFYKLFGPMAPDVHGGVPGVYVTSVDVLLLVLYGVWLAEGTLLHDLREALRRPAFYVPLLAALTVLPSFLLAESPWLALSELFRMAWMLALYVYIGVRVQDRRELMVVVAVLFFITFLQAALAAAQWKTESSLGLVRVGDESALVTRTSDDAELVRPSGTILHPVFFSAVMAEITLLALCLAMSTRRALPRLYAYASATAGVVAMILAQTRVAFFVAAAIGGILLLWGARRGHVSWLSVALALSAAALGTLVLNGTVTRGSVTEGLARNFGSEHFGVEVEARQQLSDVALDVIADAPLIGVGLNNYEQVLPRYDTYGVGMEGFPPHNLYLLVFADTGFIGLLGMLATFLALVVVALRLARAVDPQLAAIGVAALAMYAFYALEEMTSFSLRHDVPLLAFWILAGLAVAALRIAEREGSLPLHQGVHP
jgi:O-antigen ligase